jgi:glycosyltransferase involved in cell wall biosynthesis
MSKPPLSVVIITKNEEKNIEECFNSIHDLANEIIVVDDFSNDNTVEIAKKYTDKVIIKRMEIEGRHRNYAYSLASYNWILSMDADERLTLSLKNEIIETLKTPKFNGYTIPRKNYIGNYWIKYGGWYPSPQLRLFKKDKFKWEEVEVHPRAFLEGECGHLKNPLIHYSYKNFSDFINKLNRQTTLEAIKWYKENRKIKILKALRKTCDRFFKAFVLKKGYRDGFIGFMLAMFAGLYQIFSYAKYWEMKSKSKLKM